MPLKSAVDYAREHLEEAIITGELSPGTRIKEGEIASRLGISRPPLRQAFECLIVEGLITRQPRRGVFVTEIAEKDIWEIYTLKSSLYGLATSLAIDNMTNEGIAKLGKVVQLMEKYVNKEPININKYQALNEDFHVNIPHEISNHGRLLKLLRNLNNQTKRLSYKNLLDRDHLLSNCHYHQQIFDAIKKQDKILADKLCQEHIFRGMKLLQKNLEKK